MEELAADLCAEVQRRAVEPGAAPRPPGPAPSDTRDAARQRLAGLHADKLRELVIDVIVELGRRYPLVLEQMAPEFMVVSTKPVHIPLPVKGNLRNTAPGGAPAAAPQAATAPAAVGAAPVKAAAPAVCGVGQVRLAASVPGASLPAAAGL